MNESRMPDHYDRQLGSLHDLPDVVKTKPATIRVVPPLAIGGTQVFVVQTFRQRERGDTIFLEVMGQDGAVRLVLPPEVSNSIARQRDAVTARTRSKAAKASAEDRKARGIQPGFARRKA
jgi:hypothetical protein